MGTVRRIIVGRASALVSVLLLGFGILLIVGLGQATRTSQVDDALPSGADSTKAAQLREQLPSEDSSTAVVLFTGKDLTFPIEQDNSNVRHCLARFRRRTKVVSKCRTMVDLSLRLLHHLQHPAAFASYAKQLAATFG